MKPSSSIINAILLLLCCSVCAAQDLDTKIRQAETIIEGHVVSAKGFKTKTSIYTSFTITVLKVFKGNLSDSTIEIVSEGGQADGQGLDIIDGRALGLEIGGEGIFLLTANKTDNRLHNNLQSYIAPYGQSSFITYSGKILESLEKGLFQQIESGTGQKRKVLGLNDMEKPSKFSLESKVANSDAIIEGVVISRHGFRPNGTTNYNSALVKVSKVFKGNVRDSIVELVYLDGGRDDAFARSYGLTLNQNQDGIFFLVANTTGVSLKKDVPTFIPDYGKRGYIDYKWADASKQSYIGVCDKITYHNVEKDLFEKIESLTGQKRNVLSPNLFGQ